jgi:hypothetical protein
MRERAELVLIFHQHNRQNRPCSELRRAARALYRDVSWARDAKGGKRMRTVKRSGKPTSHSFNFNRSTTVKSDLKRMKQALNSGNLENWAKVWVKPSAETQRAVFKGSPSFPKIMNRRAMTSLVDEALANPSLNGRPRDRE